MDCEEERAVQYFIGRTKDRFRIKKMILYTENMEEGDDRLSNPEIIVLTESSITEDNCRSLSRIANEINAELGASLNCSVWNIIRWRRGENIRPLLKQKIETQGIDLFQEQIYF